MEKIVYFVRHGQSLGNISHVFQGPDSPLTDLGKEQAKRIAERAANLSFDVLVSSTFRRAKETAEFIADKTSHSPEFSDLFVERIKPSRTNGKNHDDPAAAELFKQWKTSLYTKGIRAEDGENFDDLVERADRALSFLEQRIENNLLVVTHGFFLRVIVARVLLGTSLSGENFKYFQYRTSVENTAITALKYSTYEEEKAWRLWTFNDHAHLG